MFTQNPVNIQGFRGATLAVSVVGATTGALEGGTYDVSCDVDVFIRVAGASATDSPDRAQDVTTANGYKIAAGNTVAVLVPLNSSIGAIAGGAGTLCYHRVN